MSKEKVSRKIQIMQTLASMLEDREPVKITTAELARRTNITEAAIYRHFPSKRKIYQELVEFFEDSICLLYTSPSPRDRRLSRMPSSA